MENARVKQIPDGENVLIKISGFISESCALFKTDFKQFKQVTIDFTDTTFINSLGIRYWIEWVNSNKLGADTKVKLAACVPSMVSQFNMIKGFLARNCEVVSIYVDYFSEGSDNNQRVLLKKGEDFEAEKENKPGWVKIKESIKVGSEEFTLDTIKEKYFSFLGKIEFQ